MLRKKLIAFFVTAIIMLNPISLFAIDYHVPEYATAKTDRFHLMQPYDEAAESFCMLSADGKLVLHIHDGTLIYFEDLILLHELMEEWQTAAEVLDGRLLTVTYAIETASMPPQTSPISVKIHYEEAVPLSALDTTVDPVLDLDYTIPPLNGEVVVNGVILENAPEPYWYETESGHVLMVPLRAVAEALEFDVHWDRSSQGIRLGVAINLWIGRDEVHFARMMPIQLSAAPQLTGSFTFVPLDFFRIPLGKTAYIFEGQVVIETYSDMH
jgi:hypothetical protein